MPVNHRRNSERNGGPRRGPTHDQIAERAYARYEERRRSADEGRSPEEDWYEAERELREAADTPNLEPEETARSDPHGGRSEDDDDSGMAESFSPRPESAEKTHAERPSPEKMPPSFSPRPESAKTTRAPRASAKKNGKSRSAKKG